MAEDETTRPEGNVAVAELPEAVALEVDAKRGKLKKPKKSKDEDPEREIEFSTPFGKLEFEFEPTSSKQKRDARKREKQEADAENAAAKALKKRPLAVADASEIAAEGGGSALVPVLLVLGLIIGGVALAFWLFARPGDDADLVPDEYLNPETAPMSAEPQGLVAKVRHRVRHAVRAGKRASREAQSEQERRFQDLTSGG